MNRNDYNLIAAVIRQALSDEETRPAVAMRLAEAFARRGDRPPDFSIEDFLNRCVPPKQKSEVGKINAGREAPPQRTREPVLIERDASLFTAILWAEFPEAKELVGCVFVPNQPSMFSVGRAGGKVWIRFGRDAAAAPIEAVRRAAPDALEMALGKTSAKEIRG